jgi:hypothetical protein
MTDELAGDLPDDRPLQIAIFGRKGSGKSELAYALWDSWPYDRVLIDVTQDVARVHPDPHMVDLDVPPPPRWPEGAKDAEDTRLTLRYVPDLHSPDWREDIDRVVGLAYTHRRTLVWVEEVGNVAPVGLPLPHMRSALNMGRHQELWSLFTGPRPMGVDPLVLANADVVYVFDLPNPADRRRVADAIGWDPKEFDAAVAALGDHEYLRYVAKTRELIHFPALPMPKRKTIARAHIEEPV